MARLFYVAGLAVALAAATTLALFVNADPTLVGSLGVSLLLVAFVVSLAGWMRSEGLAYLTLNLVGAVLACLSSHMIDFLPFVLLEGTWALVALTGLVRMAVAGIRPAR